MIAHCCTSHTTWDQSLDVAHDMISVLRHRTWHPYLRSCPAYFYQGLAKQCRVRLICFLNDVVSREQHLSHVVSGPATQRPICRNLHRTWHPHTCRVQVTSTLGHHLSTSTPTCVLLQFPNDECGLDSHVFFMHVESSSAVILLTTTCRVLCSYPNLDPSTSRLYLICHTDHVWRV